jgi:hypothetical protein
MRLVNCKACGQTISKAAPVCPHCSHPVRRRGSPILAVLLLLGIFSTLSVALRNVGPSPPTPSTALTPAVTPIPTVAVSPSIEAQVSAPANVGDKSYLAVPPAQIIGQGRALDKRMAESNRPKPTAESLKTPLITKAEVEQNREALRSIEKTASEYAEAQKLLGSLDRREEEGKRAMEAAIAKAAADDAQGRKEHAKLAERLFLNAGYDITVSTSGPKATTITLKYILLNRPVAHVLLTDGNGKESDFVDNCRNADSQRSF